MFQKFSENKSSIVQPVILVIGANGGLGSCVCQAALSRGWGVIAMDRYASVCREAIKSKDKNCRYISVDLSAPSSVLLAAEQVKADFRRLDGIVNCAGIVLGRDDTLESLNMDDMRKSMEINVYGPMELIRQLLPLIRRSPSAGIINISSSAAVILGTREIDYPYAVSKCALNMFTEKLRVFLEKAGVRVAAIHPGWMKTAMGGEDAQVEPSEVAEYLLDVLCGKQLVTAVPAFVNRFGKPVLNRNEI